MKLQEVPQDQNPSYEGVRRLCYAVDEQGKIVQAHSSGWKVEETAKSLAWKVIETDLAETRRQIRAGKTSPLRYFMKMRQMDPFLLAQNMEISVFRVHWHLRQSVFRKLSESWLQRYAECLEIPHSVLVSYRGEE